MLLSWSDFTVVCVSDVGACPNPPVSTFFRCVSIGAAGCCQLSSSLLRVHARLHAAASEETAWFLHVDEVEADLESATRISHSEVKPAEGGMKSVGSREK